MQSTLPVVERFHSLQGEGSHTGRSAFFIRLASCNVRCPWCDTKNSWFKNNFPQMNIANLSEEVANAQIKGAGFVVITGGEPLLHNLYPLCNEIRKTTKAKNKSTILIHLETSGVDPITGDPDWITLSPKRHIQPRFELIKACHELKVIVHEKEDLIFAEEIANKTRKFKKPMLFLQPGWKSKAGQNLAFEYVKNHPQWRLSMQTHKWLEVL